MFFFVFFYLQMNVSNIYDLNLKRNVATTNCAKFTVHLLCHVNCGPDTTNTNDVCNLCD